MNLTGGQNRDIDFTSSNNKFISDGKNLIVTNKFTTLESEKGNLLIANTDGIINGIINTSDSFIVFSIDNEFSEIGIYKNNEYIKIIKTIYFNFNINYPISGEYYYNDKKELIVLFYDNNDTSKLLNLDNLPFELNSDLELIDSNKIKLAEQFIPFKQPTYRLISVDDNVGNLPLGMYYVTIQYRLEDGTYTNNADLSNSILVVKSGKGEKWENYTGYYKDVKTNKSISIELGNIDTLFKQFRVNIIIKTYAETLAYTGELFNVSGLTNITISDISNYTIVDISKLLTKNISFKSIGTTTKIQNRLYLANLETYPNLKYQKYANNIHAQWVYNSQVSLDGIKGSYKDELLIYNNKGFTPGEVYNLYIRFINKDVNKPSMVFHIPGRDAFTGDTELSTNPEVMKVYSNARKFHIEDTCTIVDSDNGIGEMSYWENESEYYPDASIDKDKEYNGALDYDLNTIPNGRNLQGTNVKHHRFPTVNYLVNNLANKKIVGTFENITNYSYVKFEPNEANYDIYGKSAVASYIDSSTLGIFPSSNIWINNTQDDVTLNLTYNLSITISNRLTPNNPSPNSNGIITIYKLDANKNRILTIDTISTSGIDKSLLTLLVNTNTITISPNEGIEIYMYGYSDGDDISINFNGDFTGEFGVIPTVSGNTFGRILALKLSNIFITDEIKANYSHFEILYAERTTANLTVLGTSLIPYFLGDSNFDYSKFLSFDLLANKLEVSPSHLLLDYIYENIDNTNAQNIIDANVTILPIANDNYIHAIDGASYIPNGNSESDPNNQYGTEYLHLKYASGSAPNNIIDISKYQYLIATLIAFKSNLYRPFNNQKLVRTGNIINISDLASSLEVPTNLVASLLASGTLSGTYYYKVCAINNTGITLPSLEVFETVDGGTTNGSIHLSWNTVLSATKYRIFRGTVSNSQTEYYDSVLPNITDDGTLTFVSGIIPTESISYINLLITNTIFGGDTFFNLHGLSIIDTKNVDVQDTFSKIGYYLVPEYSISNIGLRYLNDNIYDIFYPKYNLIDNINGVGTTFGPSQVDDNDLTGTNFYGQTVSGDYDSLFTKMIKALNQYDNKYFKLTDIAEYYGYNKIYNSINDLQEFLTFNIAYDYITSFPNTIYRTLPTNNENNNLNWRNILANEYVISVLDRKEIINLDSDDRDLLVEHRYGLFIYKFIGQLNINTNVISSLGDSDIFKNKPFEAIPDGLGYVGCQSKFGSIRTKFGNIIVDREQGKIFIYNNNQIEEITKKDMRVFFMNNLQYDNVAIINNAYLFDDTTFVLFDNGATVDVSNNSEEINKIIDNPFGGIGIFCAWDEEYERLIITKLNTIDDSFSIDYYPAIKAWGLFHTMIPTYMFNNRFGLFSLYHTSLFKLNVGKPGQFYLNDTQGSEQDIISVKSYIDVVFNKRQVTSKRFKSILWKTLVTILDSQDIDTIKTFNSIIIFNYNKHSNKITLTNKTFGNDNGNVRWSNSLWEFNDFRDILKTKDIQIIDKNLVDELKVETLTGTQIVDNWYNKSLFIDDFIIVRLIFNNDNGDSIIIKDVFVNSNKIVE